jgi:peptide methionine sulfoxide reductase msrA/msrB
MGYFLDKISSLTPSVRAIICDKGTEPPNTGAYHSVELNGSYLCRRCGLALFRAGSQFSASCGWPSFDQSIADVVAEVPDKDRIRMEIQCHRCGGHLGHVFTGEFFTSKNKRYCVNSLSMDFIGDQTVIDTEEMILAGGCFWGVDYYMRRIHGVLTVEVGYTGGAKNAPTYHEVCHSNTGHYEAVRVIYDKDKTDYRTVLKRFFEIHDPTQRGGQGPDIGEQYQSCVFYYDKKQQKITEELIRELTLNGYQIATKILPVQPFWSAEEAHQNYYSKHNKLPYCHKPVERFK